MFFHSCLFSSQVQQKVSEVEVREKELFDWRKTVSEVECKLTQQENLLECAVKERNLYSRNLIEAQVQLVQLFSCDRISLTDKCSRTDSWILGFFSIPLNPCNCAHVLGRDCRNKEKNENHEQSGHQTER